MSSNKSKTNKDPASKKSGRVRYILFRNHRDSESDLDLACQ